MYAKVFKLPHKKQVLTVVLQNCEKSGVKHSIEKAILLNLLDLPTIFCPSMPKETNFHF